MARNALGAYQKVQANTSTPIQRVLMVYNGINKNLKLAIDAFDNANPDRFVVINNSIQLAEKLIGELQAAIDKTNGGELAVQLDDLYAFWIKHLAQANREKNRQMVIEVQQMVADLTSGWVEVEKQLKNGTV